MRLTFTATRVQPMTTSAATTSKSWPAPNPTRAPSDVHRSAKTTPPSTITVLASHGSNCCRSRPASRVSKPGCAAAALLPWAGSANAFHLAIPARQYRATAATAAIRPASADSDHEGRAPKPRKCAIVPSGPVLRVSQEISGGAASIASARPAVSAAAQLTSNARLAPRSLSSGFTDAHQRARLRGRAGSSVSHQ